jgi:hypothetical protein
MEEFVKELGFESEKEFHELNSTPDLTNPKIMNMYLDWKYNDGTKEGLIKVIEASQVN